MLPTWGLEPRRGFGGPFVAMLFALSSVASSYDLNPNSTQSVKTIAKSMVDNLMTFYHGDEPGHTPGLLPDPYYWWEAGAMMGTLIEYWFYTGDSEYVNTTKQALLFQVGEYDDYMPINQTRTEGNDDQGFWGLAVMSAAEYNFPHPAESEPQWLALAQAVFNTQAARWDTEHCGGGLRWQIFQWNNGYNYKNSISQACFFALGARLALFTGNNTYADWADKTWDWMVKVEFINEEKNWAVYDGAHIETGCTNIVPYQFSYNVGGFILGAAAMYNHTESDVWKDRLDNLIEGVKVFFTGPDKDIMAEVACEPVKLCNVDQQSFKAYLTRWLAVTTQWAPHTADVIRPLLRTSAVAAAKQCVGGDNGEMCGMIWTQDKYDGSTGVGQQMAAIEITLSCMIGQRRAPLTADTGGTSKGDSGAGSEDIGRTEPNRNWRKITAGDKAGAAILTTLVIGVFVFGVGWLMVDEQSERSAADQFNDFCASTIASIGGAGSVAAVLHRKDSTVVREKAALGANSSSDGSLKGAREQDITDLPPVVIGNVRNREPNHQRRVSSMPIGWPHNPSMRGSVMYDPDAIYPMSATQSRIDLAGVYKTANFSRPELNSTDRRSQTSEITQPAEPPRRSVEVFYDSTEASGSTGDKHMVTDTTNSSTEQESSENTSQNTEARDRSVESSAPLDNGIKEHEAPIEDTRPREETDSALKEKESPAEPPISTK